MENPVLHKMKENDCEICRERRSVPRFEPAVFEASFVKFQSQKETTSRNSQEQQIAMKRGLEKILPSSPFSNGSTFRQKTLSNHGYCFVFNKELRS